VAVTKPNARVQRRLAAIFCADVAGYVRLMNADEGGTLRLLTAHREVTDREIEQSGGRIANTAGDSILAEFPSAVDALQCALDIQERIAAVNREIPEERRVSFRIGLHVGEAMVRDGDLFGDGVNIAARMQALAPPGAVCMSGAAYEFVHRALPMPYESLGPQQVKNIDTPIPPTWRGHRPKIARRRCIRSTAAARPTLRGASTTCSKRAWSRSRRARG
jgi:class 3 adenylate cyclase